MSTLSSRFKGSKQINDLPRLSVEEKKKKKSLYTTEKTHFENKKLKSHIPLTLQHSRDLLLPRSRHQFVYLSDDNKPEKKIIKLFIHSRDDDDDDDI